MDGAILNESAEVLERAVNDITDGDGFDVTIEAVGLPDTFQNCIDSACFGGRVVQIGIGKKTQISIYHDTEEGTQYSGIAQCF